MHNSDYKNAMQNIKYSDDFEQNTLDMLNSKNAEMLSKKAHLQTFNFKRISTVAATFAVVVTIGIISTVHFLTVSDFDLVHSKGVKVNYTQHIPMEVRSATDFEESDILAISDLIVSGVVLKIDNIKIDFGNRSVMYSALVTLTVDETLKGGNMQGQQITVFVPAPITGDDSDTISSLCAGSRLLFFLKQYTKDDHKEEGNAVFYYQDICKYGLPDSRNYTIIDAARGLVYEEKTWQFPQAFYFDELTAYIKEEAN